MAVRVVRGARLRRVALGGPLPLVVGLYSAAAVAATWPAVASFGSAFMADGADGHGEAAAGDHLQAVYRFWLAGHQLERGEAPWVDPYSFQPLVEPQTVLGAWPFALPFWPLDAVFGPVVAWNLLLLGTIVAGGLLTYWWLRALELSPAGAFVGGLAFALAPYRLAQSGVHLLGWVAILLPLALLGIERARAAGSRRAAHAWGAVAALAIVSVPLSGQVHLALGAIPFVVAYALVRWGRVPLAWAAGGALAAVGVGLAIRYGLIAGSAEEGGRSLEEVGEFSAEWIDLLSRWQLGELEDFVYLGWLTPLLAAAGVVLLWRGGRRGLATVLGLAALVPPLLALGTHLPFYSWLWHAFPPFRYPRVPGRLLPLADLALAGLAAVAVARAVSLAGRRAAAATALAALVAADLLVLPLGASVAKIDNRAYVALREHGPGRLLELPLVEPGIHFASVYDLYATRAPRERLSGYSTLVPPEAFSFYFTHNRISCGVWLPGDEEALEMRDVEYAAFHEGLYGAAEIPGAWFAWRGVLAHGFAPQARDGAITLLGRGDQGRASGPSLREPSRTRPLLCEGWRRHTMVERQAPLWIFGSGSLGLAVSTPTPLDTTLWVDGERLPAVTVTDEMTLQTELEGRRWHAVVVEIPELLDTSPPRGLRLERVSLSSAP